MPWGLSNENIEQRIYHLFVVLRSPKQSIAFYAGRIVHSISFSRCDYTIVNGTIPQPNKETRPTDFEEWDHDDTNALI